MNKIGSLEKQLMEAFNEEEGNFVEVRDEQENKGKKATNKLRGRRWRKNQKTKRKMARASRKNNR